MKAEFVIALSAAVFLPGCATIDAIVNIEEPAYTVIKQEGDFELRVYRSMIVAETTVSGSLDSAGDNGFRAIAGYIFGANTSKGTSSREKIAMTVPVTMQPGSTPDRWRMHFVMPGKYNLESLPTPENPAVTLRQIAPQRVAVNRFSGFSGETKVAEKTAALNLWVAKNDLKPIGTAQLARYNAPITPPPFRRNEILLTVE
jgi:SOUL heme-binding protein